MKIFKRTNGKVSFTGFKKASVVAVDLIIFENKQGENLELLFRDVKFTFRVATLKRESEL